MTTTPIRESALKPPSGDDGHDNNPARVGALKPPSEDGGHDSPPNPRPHQGPRTHHRTRLSRALVGGVGRNHPVSAKNRGGPGFPIVPWKGNDGGRP